MSNIDGIFNLEVLENAEQLKGKTIKNVINTYDQLYITTEDGCYYQLDMYYHKGFLTDEMEASFTDVTKEQIKKTILYHELFESDEEFIIGLLDYEKYKAFVSSSPITERRTQKLEEIRKKKNQLETLKYEIRSLENDIGNYVY